MVDAAEKRKSGGLAGIVAGDSSICLCGVEEQSLRYRGYSIEDLAKHASFEEVAWLLLRGQLPTQQQLGEYKKRLKNLRDLPQAQKSVLELLPGTSNKMDILRTGCSLMGNIEPEQYQKDPFLAPDRLIASLSSLLFYWQHFQNGGKRINLNTSEDTIAGQILFLMNGKPPSEEQRRCLDASLILYAEHEFNASTFTVRTIASTLSDFYSAICGGIGKFAWPTAWRS